jgi:hypothetical protein
MFYLVGAVTALNAALHAVLFSRQLYLESINLSQQAGRGN